MHGRRCCTGNGYIPNKTSFPLIKGKTDKLTATITPEDATDKALNWGSSDTSVVTVDENGKVTATGGGSAEITVTTHDGSFTATCGVNVTVPVTGIKLNSSSLSLAKGRSSTLTATITPSDATDKKITWASSNTSAVTVDSSGTITSVGYGTAVITARTHDGGFTAKCKVTVGITWSYSITQNAQDDQQSGDVSHFPVNTSDHPCTTNSKHSFSLDGSYISTTYITGSIIYSFNGGQGFLMRAGQTIKCHFYTAYKYSGYESMLINDNETTPYYDGPNRYSCKYKGAESNFSDYSTDVTYKFTSDTLLTSIKLNGFTEGGRYGGYEYEDITINSDYGSFLLNNSGSSVQ